MSVCVSRQMLRPSVWCAMRRVCVCVCVTRGLLMSVSTGSGMDVCMRGWVGGCVFLGKGIKKKTNYHDAMTQFCWVVLICTVQFSC